MSAEAATAALAAPVSHSDSGDDLMSDFVVLSKSPQEESLLMVENPALTNLQLSLPSNGSEISLDEAERCIQDLLRENKDLKGKLNVSNAWIVPDYTVEPLATFRFAVADDHKEQRVRVNLCLEIVTEMVEILRRALTTTLYAKRWTTSGFSVSTKATCQLKANYDLADLREANIEIVIQATKGILSKDNRTAKYSKLKEVQEKSPEAKNSSPVRGCLCLCAPLFLCLQTLSEVLVQLHQEQTKTAHQSEEIQYLNQELLKLNLHRKESSEQMAKLKARLSQAEARRTEVGYHEAVRIAQLEAAISEKDAVVRALQDQSTKRASEVDELRQALLKAEQRHEKAKTDYAELLRTWQEFENSSDSGERDFVQVEARPGALRTQLEAARKEVQDKLIALAERDRQLTGLRDERTRLQQQLELMPPLQAQVEVFRADYNAEKEARVGLETRLRDQQRIIQDLQDQLAALQLAQQQERQQPRYECFSQLRNHPCVLLQLTSLTDSNLPCPLCGASCATRDVYIRHVQSCADGDGGFR
ncbi:unnamed protein product [Ixodes hexagonus]